MNKILKTDWNRVDKMSDEDIDYSEHPEVTEAMFKLMKFREPDKKGIYIKLDQEVIEFFKKTSKKYQVKINEVLKAYQNAVEGIKTFNPSVLTARISTPKLVGRNLGSTKTAKPQLAIRAAAGKSIKEKTSTNTIKEKHIVRRVGKAKNK